MAEHASTFFVDGRINLLRPLANQVLKTANWNGIFGYGQSLSIGADGKPPLHTDPAGVSGHLSFDNGPDYPNGTDFNAVQPLFEEVKIGRGNETPCSGMAEAITHYLLDAGEPDLITLHGTMGVGGQGIYALRYGNGWYTALALTHPAAKARAVAANKTYSTPALWFVHGESDAFDGTMTKAQYFNYYVTMSNQISTDFEDPEILITQSAAYSRTWPAINLAQIQIDEEISNSHLVTPVYFLSLAAGSNIHLSASSYQEMGFRLGRAFVELKIQGKVNRIKVLSVLRHGESKIVITFQVPAVPLKWNTARVPLMTDYGFQLTDVTGIVPLTSVETLGDDTVIITANRIINGASVLTYGLAYASPIGIINGSGGNLTDSTDDDVWINGARAPLEHWCPAFSIVPTIFTGPNYPLALVPVETSAWEHWNLKTNSTSLTGLTVNARVLTPVGTGAAITFDAKAAITTAGLASMINGLQSTFPDQLGMTIAMVFKRPPEVSLDYHLFAGTCNLNTEVGVGVYGYSNNPPGYFISSGFSVAIVNTLNVFYSAAAKFVGDWCFVAYRDNAGKHGAVLGGGGPLVENPTARSGLSGRNIGFGNCYAPFTTCDNSLEIAEAIIYNSALTEDQIRQLYLRSKTRMAVKGISI